MIKFKLPTEMLHQFAQDLGRTIPSLTTVEILKGMYIHFDKDVITAVAFNGAVAVRLERELDQPLAIEPFDIVLSHPKLVSLLKKLNGATTSFKYDPERESIELLSGGSKYRLQAIPSKEYPDVADMIGRMKSAGTLLAEDISVVYSSTTGFVSKSETRPILQGVHHSFVGNGVIDVHSTDSHILRKINLQIEDDGVTPESTSYAAPALFTNEMSRLLSKREDCTVRMRLSDRAIAYDWTVEETRTTYTVYGRVIDGAFPSVERLTHITTDVKVQMSKATILEMLSRIQSTSDEGEHAVLAFKGSKAKLLTRGQFPTVESFSLDSPYQADEPFIATFSTQYLQTAVRSFVEDSLWFHLGGPQNPLFITSIDDDGEGMALALPLRTSDQINIDWGPEEVVEDNEIDAFNLEAVIAEEPPAPRLAAVYKDLYDAFDDNRPDADLEGDEYVDLNLTIHNIDSAQPTEDEGYAAAISEILSINDEWMPDFGTEYHSQALLALNNASNTLAQYNKAKAVLS